MCIRDDCEFREYSCKVHALLFFCDYNDLANICYLGLLSFVKTVEFHQFRFLFTEYMRKIVVSGFLCEGETRLRQIIFPSLSPSFPSWNQFLAEVAEQCCFHLH